jgi:sigma-E factor negative regulatory protein RseC
MIEVGRIRTIQGSTLSITRENDIACFGCMDQECKARAFSYTAENTAGLTLTPGQLVETETAASPLKEGLAVLLPPPLGFIAAYVLTGLISPASGDPARAAAGILSLLAIASALYLIRRRRPPRIIRRVIRVINNEI